MKTKTSVISKTLSMVLLLSISNQSLCSSKRELVRYGIAGGTGLVLGLIGDKIFGGNSG